MICLLLRWPPGYWGWVCVCEGEMCISNALGGLCIGEMCPSGEGWGGVHARGMCMYRGNGCVFLWEKCVYSFVLILHKCVCLLGNCVSHVSAYLSLIHI